MKNLNDQELTFMLCSTGYLPPRTEEEEIFFEQMYEDYKPKLKNRHVNVDAIISGQCRFVSSDSIENEIKLKRERKFVEETGHMAARNFNKLPKETIDKIRNQHRIKK